MRYRVVGSTVSHRFTVELQVPQYIETATEGRLWVQKVTFEYHYRSGSEGVDVSLRLRGRSARANGEMGIRSVSVTIYPEEMPRENDTAFEKWLRAIVESHAPEPEAQFDELVPVTKEDGRWLV